MLGLSPQRLIAATLVSVIVPILVVAFQSRKTDKNPAVEQPSHLGKIVDLEGVVSVQSLGESRGILARPGQEVSKGEWIRTGSGGAHAVRIRLGSDTLITLGPATQVELVSTTRVRLSGGTIAVNLRAGDSQLEILGTGDSKPIVVSGKTLHIFHAKDNANEISRLEKEPLWLQGFNSTAATNGVGSLVATIGERKVPLSLAAHRVDVQIRDQIARTTIIETFANHTNERLEGEFFFPLPAEASVSGFAMWIGDELVEADVVEKMRARQIFNTIVSECKDPALLEWTAGNVFKARVFPIEPKSEKKVQIVYTQVLPMKNSRFQYDLSLESELLQTNPVRELAINVLVHSQRPIKRVSCPTHAVRIETTQSADKQTHNVLVQFSAQNFIADRDFRIVCELEETKEPLTAISHQRGDDGYFMLQVSPPHGPGELKEATNKNDPLQLLILCDTSGSMSKSRRKLQARFVETLLHSLSPRDRFNLSCCDAEVVWAFKKSVRCKPKTIQTAVTQLEQRSSLGWSDLGLALESAVAKSTQATHVIYLGDGISTAVRKTKPTTAAQIQVIGLSPETTFHAVGLGNSVDATTLTSLAEVGHGTVRQIRHLSDAATAVEELLGDIESPGWSDLTFEFTGIRVAAVYPQKLPRVAQGTQQLVVGRFLPGQDGVAKGSVVVKGKRGQESFTFSKQLDFSQEAGAQARAVPGSSTRARRGSPTRARRGSPDPAVATTAQRSPTIHPSPAESHVSAWRPFGFQPCWSLPVRGQETRAQRRAVPGSPDPAQNADTTSGNSFIPRLWARHYLNHLISQGPTTRDQVIEMSQRFHIITPYTSMLVLETQADRDRFGVKRRFEMRDGERFFATAKRDASYELKQQRMRDAKKWKQGLQRQIVKSIKKLGRDVDSISMGDQSENKMPDSPDHRTPVFKLDAAANDVSDEEWSTRFGGFGGGFFGGSGGGLGGGGGGGGFFGGGGGGGGGGFGGSSGESADFQSLIDLIQRETGSDWETVDASSMNEFEQTLSLVISQTQSVENRANDDGDWSALANPDAELTNMSELFADGTQDYDSGLFGDTVTSGLFGMDDASGVLQVGFLRPASSVSRSWEGTEWMSQILPDLRLPTATYARGLGFGVTNYKPWPKKYQEIADRLLRRSGLGESGLVIEYELATHDPRWERVKRRSKELQLVSKNTWLIKPLIHFSDLEWCGEQEYGVYSMAYELGQVRSAVEGDRDLPSTGWRDGALDAISEFSHPPKRVTKSDERLVIEIEQPLGAFSNKAQTQKITIDTQRNVVLKIVDTKDTRVVKQTIFSDFVQLAGKWWARKQTTRNEKDEIIEERSRKLKLLGKKAFAARFDQETPDGSDGLLLKQPFNKLSTARKAIQAGKASFEDRLVVLAHEAGFKNWNSVLKQWRELKQARPKRLGLKWLDVALLHQAHRYDEFHKATLQLVKKVAQNPTRHSVEYFELLRLMIGVLGESEQLEILDVFELAAKKFPGHWDHNLIRMRAHLLVRLKRTADAAKLQEEIFAVAPWNLWRQLANAREMAKTKGPKFVFDYLMNYRDNTVVWTSAEWGSIQSVLIDIAADNQQRLKLSEEWLKKSPTDSSALSRYLSVLEYTDRTGQQVSSTVKEWLAAGKDKNQSKVQLARASAALVWVSRRADDYAVFEEKEFRQLLAQAVIRISINKNGIEQLFRSHIIRGIPEAQSILKKWRHELATEGQTMDPARMQRLTKLTAQSGNLTERAQIAKVLHARWLQEKERKTIEPIERSLREVLKSISDARASAFDLERGERLKQEQQQNAVSTSANKDALFEHLMELAWTKEREDQLFDSVGFDSWESNAARREYSRLHHIHEAVEHSIKSRIQAERQQLQQKSTAENWTRKRLLKAIKESQETAVTELASRLKKMESQSNPLLNDWLRMERLFLETPFDKNLAEHSAFCWKLLGAAPASALEKLNKRLDRKAFNKAAAKKDRKRAKRDAEDAANANQGIVGGFGGPGLFGGGQVFDADDYEHLDRLLLQRAFMHVMNQAAKPSAKAKQRERLLRYIEAGINDKVTTDSRWKLAKVAFLIAIDDAKSLELALSDWIQNATPTDANTWRLVLARVVAERGDLQTAIRLTETVKRQKGLLGGDSKLLADWYLATNQKQQYETALADSWNSLEEWEIVSAMSSLAAEAMQSSNPSEFSLPNRSVIQAQIQAGNAEGSIMMLQQLYRQSKRPELLRAFPFAILGHSRQGIYKAIQESSQDLIELIENESGIDAILAGILEIRLQFEKSKEVQRKPNATDLRALDLLEALAEQRASRLIDQPKPHVDRCRQAIQRACEHDWLPGERSQMARLLASAAFSHDAVFGERLRQMKLLFDAVKLGTVEGNEVAVHLGRLYEQRAAQRVYDANEMNLNWQHAMDVYKAAWLATLNEDTRLESTNWQLVFFNNQRLLRRFKRYIEAEAMLDAAEQKASLAATKTTFRAQRQALWIEAFKNRGRVSIGQGADLFENLLSHFDRQLKAQKVDVATVVRVIRAAHKLKYKSASGKMQDFVNEHAVPILLNLQSSKTSGLLSNIYQGAKHVVSPEFAVGFLLNYIETRNAHGRFTKPGPLSRYGDDVARVLKQHPELEGRVLELAKRNLRQSLIHNSYTANRFCFNPHNGAYMRQHFDEFARVADDVIDTYGSCPAVVNSVATYLFQGLNDYRHSIRVLMDAHARQTINTSGLGLLCQFVEQAKLRKANVADLNIVEILKSMVEANPHKLSYRRHLALAFKRHKQPQQLEKLLDEAYAFFSAAESENEFEHSQGLVQLLSEFGRHDQAVEYLIREIAYWKEQVDRDESYEGQYGCLTRLAASYLVQGKTKAAIDARLESMKFWNEDHGDDPVQDLGDTLYEVDDLVSIEKWLIGKLESSGSEQPIVRKAVGMAWQGRDNLKSAAGHFEVALKYEPADSELRRELIEVYDQLERPDDKRRHVLLLIEWSLTNDRDSLVDLLFSLGDEVLDLRMATNLVEVLPDDADAHLQLAELWDADETRELAILVVQKATELEPNDQDAFFHLVELQIESAQWQAATWSLERIRKTKWAGEETDRIKQWSKTLSTKQKASKAKPKSDNPFE